MTAVASSRAASRAANRAATAKGKRRRKKRRPPVRADRKVTKNGVTTKWNASYPTVLEDAAYELALSLMTRNRDLSAIGRHQTPGSDVARREGCTCDPVRNQYGAGRSFGDSWGRPHFEIDPACKLHSLA